LRISVIVEHFIIQAVAARAPIPEVRKFIVSHHLKSGLCPYVYSHPLKIACFKENDVEKQIVSIVYVKFI
jgi:hypothetical protein